MGKIYMIGSIANMIMLWNITSWDVLEVIFMGFVCCILEIWGCILAKAILQRYLDWQIAEQVRVEQAAARQRRRNNYKDYDLRQTEEDEWYEVPLDQTAM